MACGFLVWLWTWLVCTPNLILHRVPVYNFPIIFTRRAAMAFKSAPDPAVPAHELPLENRQTRD